MNEVPYHVIKTELIWYKTENEKLKVEIERLRAKGIEQLGEICFDIEKQSLKTENERLKKEVHSQNLFAIEREQEISELTLELELEGLR